MKNHSTLEFALMGLMRQKPQSGYDLRKTFATTVWRHYSDSPGSIYPALKRIESRGWIEAVGGGGESADPRRRQGFQPTADGQAAFVAWLERPLSREDVRFRMPETMLRFAFMDGCVPRSVTVRFLDRLIEELAVYADELRAQGEQMRSMIEQATRGPAVHTGLLAFESGIEGNEAQLAWARKARSKLKGESE